MHVPPPHARLKAATPATVVGPVRVEVPAVQLTEYRQACSAVVLMLSIGFAEPAGGGVEPSRSAGSMLCAAVVSLQICRAERPESMRARSSAQTFAPEKVRPPRSEERRVGK